MRHSGLGFETCSGSCRANVSFLVPCTRPSPDKHRYSIQTYREIVKHIDSTVLFGVLSTAVPILACAMCRHKVVTGNERRTKEPLVT